MERKLSPGREGIILPSIENLIKQIKSKINHLRSFVQRKYPKIYNFIIEWLSPWILVLTQRQLLLDCKQAHWRLQFLKGQNILLSQWSGANSLEFPLTLPLENIVDLKVQRFRGFECFNPTITIQSNIVKIGLRISDNIASPITDKSGNSLNPVVGFRGGIAIGTADKENFLKDGIIDKLQVVIDPNFDSRFPAHQIQDNKGRVFEFDDPRFVLSRDNLLLIHGRLQPQSHDGRSVNFVPFILNLENMKLQMLNLPNMSIYEKNWVPIASHESSCLLLRSSNPLSVLEFDDEHNFLSERNIESFLSPDLHNGSNFIHFENEYMMRVVRKRIHLNGLKAIHVSSIILHDLNLKPILQTKYFVFDDFGFEICNSIVNDGNRVIFSWGVNDSKSRFGTIESSKLSDWITKYSL